MAMKAGEIGALCLPRNAAVRGRARSLSQMKRLGRGPRPAKAGRLSAPRAPRLAILCCRVAQAMLRFGHQLRAAGFAVHAQAVLQLALALVMRRQHAQGCARLQAQALHRLNQLAVSR